jgi:uncharacterized protein DUF4443/CggR-like protein
LTSLQLLNALIMIDREGPLGRRALAGILQVNDGVVRGLLERLAEGKLVFVTDAGVKLTKKGKQILTRLFRQLSIRKILPLDGSGLITGNKAIGIHLSSAYKPGITGIAQRDEAIRAGAEGSITVAIIGRKLAIPPDNKDLAKLAPEEDARLRIEFNLSDRDLIIIGFAKDSGRALAGALAAVLSLRR